MSWRVSEASPRPATAFRGLVTPPRYPSSVDLFDRDEVTPPQPCSRCGVDVVATSLFCPECGQSMVNPLRKPPVPEEPQQEQEAVAEEPDQTTVDAEQQKRSTLSRTTEWIIKSIQRVQSGASGIEKSEEPTQEPSPATDLQRPVQPGLLPESTVRKTSSWPERLQQSSRAQKRFVLVGPSGEQHTLGEALTGLGSAPSAPEGESMLWLSVGPLETIDPLHLRCGVEDGLLWLEDNNSVFGTIIEEPGRQALQCIPFERYFVLRGSTIRLGSHTFTLQ